MPFFGAMYYVLRCRTSLTVTSTAILTSPSNYAYFGTRPKLTAATRAIRMLKVFLFILSLLSNRLFYKSFRSASSALHFKIRTTFPRSANTSPLCTTLLPPHYLYYWHLHGSQTHNLGISYSSPKGLSPIIEGNHPGSIICWIGPTLRN